MTAPITAFPSDRSQRWILLPGVASARQVEIRNETGSPLEIHLRVEAPAAASASPARLTIPPSHSRTAHVNFLANWSTANDGFARIALLDSRGNRIASFEQEIISADSSDCSLALELRDGTPTEHDNIDLKLWCTVASRSSTPRRFRVDFVPHPALRFEETKILTLSPGESIGFEVPVRWDRSIRDTAGWNHPREVEAFALAGEGRRNATLGWEQIEQRLAHHLTADDRKAKFVFAKPLDRRQQTTFLQKAPGQLKYEELVEIKRLEQSVVGQASTRASSTAGLESGSSSGSGWRRFPLAPLATIAFAVAALAMAGLFFLRPPQRQLAERPIPVSPLKLSSAASAHKVTARGGVAAVRPQAIPVWTTVAQAASTPQTVTQPVHALTRGAKAIALAPRAKTQRAEAVDRNQVVVLSGVAANYARGGRSVNVGWNGSAQAAALVQLVDFDGKVIASRSIRGGATGITMPLPRGYHGPVYVNVTAFGYHGERVAATASAI